MLQEIKKNLALIRKDKRDKARIFIITATYLIELKKYFSEGEVKVIEKHLHEKLEL